MASFIKIKHEWYILTVISGKEQAIAENVKERVATYGYLDMVSNIQIIQREKIEHTIFNKNDSTLPKSLKDTKISKWETLSDDKYQKTTTKITNKFPGYVFIKMIYDKDLWFVIRNTQGVLGFVGSSGKGAKPIPISEGQYNNSLKKINDEKIFVDELIIKSVKSASDDVLPAPEVKYDFIIGDIVEIEKGKFISNGGKIVNIDKESGLATIEVNENDTTINIEVPLANLRK